MHWFTEILHIILVLRCSGQNSGCCTKKKPCKVNEGDCDNDKECKGHLKCGKNNCNRKSYSSFSALDDCCYEPKKGKMFY